jgi:hypothetical protein
MISLSYSGIAQRNANWFFGDSAGISFINNIPFPVSGSIESNEESAVFSDVNGNLLFYVGPSGNNTLTYKVFSKNHLLMTNGDSIFGISPLSQGIFIIPFENDSAKYFIVHQDGGPHLRRLYYSVVDMNINAGLGAVIIKNAIVDSTNFLIEKRAVVRHGNGRDWWIISHAITGDTYVKYLIVNDTLTGPFYQHIGTNAQGDPGGQMTISPDGTKLFLPSFLGEAELYDFNRCTGELSNRVYWADPVLTWGRYYGSSFSTNNYLYYSSHDSLWQMDANNSNPILTNSLIWADNNPNACIGQHLIGPDNKIYIVSFRGLNCMAPNQIFDSLNMHLTVIDAPNLPGSLCNVLPYSVSLGGRRSFTGLPTMPNYNLGALSQSGCDSLTSLNTLYYSDEVYLYPNPVKDVLTVNCPYCQNITNTKAIIYNALGVKVFSFLMDSKKNIQSIDLSSLATGLYLVKFTGSGIVGRIVKL